MPKVSVHSKLQLVESLKKRGITSLFSSTADLTGLTGSPGLAVDSVIQQAVLEISEKGTKASAVTGISISRNLPMFEPHMQVEINRPFMMILRDQNTKVNLFIGRVSDPTDLDRTTMFDLSLPKFSVKSQVTLNAALQQLGLKQIFSSAADLSGLTGQKGISVDKIIQQAVIEISEKGTKAAAVTGMSDKAFYTLSLPKLKLEHTLPLKDVLRSMGIRQMFDAVKADLSAMTGRSDLYVSSGLQKAVIEINERGTAAAAASGFGVVNKSLFFGKHINVNHPFMFVLRDTTTKINLFQGRFSDPRA